MHKTTKFISLAIILLLAFQVSANTKLLRFPDIHDDKIVFSYAGDLWLVSVNGGKAQQLTTHPGLELFPKFSPDGNWVAFTGQYEGDEQVYVIATNGGEPKQLTFYPANGPLPPRWGYDHQVYGWTFDNKKILFRSMRDGWDLTDTRLYTVNVDGGLPEPLPMPVSGGGIFANNEQTIFYSPLTRDFRTWKRYQGGWAQDLYLFDVNTNTAKQITKHPRTDRDPMWINGKGYFASDRDGKLNLYSYDSSSSNIDQLTFQQTWDVRWPSTDGSGKIIYELNGELEIFDVNQKTVSKVNITVPSDLLATRTKYISVANNITDFNLSPKAKRALFVARGDIFSTPVEKGLTRNLTKSSNAHDREASWSPNGKKIAFISDLTGEEELYTINSDGSGHLTQLTFNSQTRYYAPKWSPNGEHIAFTDKEGQIYVIATSDQNKPINVANEISRHTSDYQWSPDSNYLTFSLSDDTDLRSIYIWNLKDNKLNRVTGPHFNEFSPSWSVDGNLLFFLADHEFAPQLGSREWNYMVNRETGVFALALNKTTDNPFAPENEEAESLIKKTKKKKKSKGKKKDKEKEEKIKVNIEFDGLSQRVIKLPIEASNYSFLRATLDHLLLAEQGADYYGRDSELATRIKLFDFEDKKLTTLAKKVDALAIAGNNKTILVQHEQRYKTYQITSNGDDPKTVVTTGLKTTINPKQEWETIYHEVWRRFRDFFYVENMHGYDWEALRTQYKPWLEHIGHRSDLNYLMGELIAELNVSHAYVSGGDAFAPKRPKIGLLGAKFELDEKHNRYRISEILAGQNEEEKYRSPLTEVGVNIKLDDYILAINGEELTGNINPYRLLRKVADEPIELLVNSKPEQKTASKVLVKPINSESNLIYWNWVNHNRQLVAEASNNQIGYLHIPDMGDNGIYEFIKWFYGQTRKSGLIIDVRNNGGGNVSQMIIERLSRKVLGLDFPRTIENPTPYPYNALNNHMVCLMNENSASDGDLFPWMFRKKDLGPLIGKRSWGGIIGITNHGPVLDSGQVYVPQFGNADADGSWAVEGKGVQPDMVVENDVNSIINGVDNQLQRGIQEILNKLETDPKQLPSAAPDPIKLN